MRNFTFKGLFLAAMFMVLGSLAIQAADNGLITRQVTVKVYEAGTLSEKIAYNKMYKITNLKIIGEINGTDLRVIREWQGMRLVMIQMGNYLYWICQTQRL